MSRHSPLAALNRGLIQGLAIGQGFRRERRQEEAQKTLRELQERRVGIEERNVELRERSAELTKFSTLTGLLTNTELSKPENAGLRDVLLEEFVRTQGGDRKKQPQLDALLKAAKTSTQEQLKTLADCIARFGAQGGEFKNVSLAECQKQLLEIAKEKRATQTRRIEAKEERTFRTGERVAGEQAKAIQARASTFQGRIDQAVGARTFTKERGEELKRQRFETEAAPKGPLVDLGGLSDREQVKALTKLRDNINEQKQAAITIVRKANRIVGVLGNDATPLAIVGWVSRIGNSVKEQARAIASASGVDFGHERFDFGSFIDQTAVKSVQVRTNVISLAFSIAKRDNEGRVTERDVQAALDQIGGGSGSTLQMRAALGEIVTNTINTIDDFIAINQSTFEGSKVSTPSLLREDLKKIGIEPLSRLNAGLPSGVPSGSKLVDQTKEGLPVYKLPSGELKVLE